MPRPLNRTHFSNDERCIGGALMVQQQFLDMYEKIKSARKMVDDNPPQTSMFRRPYFNKVGREPWQQVGALRPNTAKSRVDCSPPDSFPYLETLYINKSSRARSQRSSKKSTSPAKIPHRPMVSADIERPFSASIRTNEHFRFSNSINKTQLDAQSPSHSTRKSAGELLKAKKALNAMESYMNECDRRKEELRAELVKISTRRAHRQQMANPAESLSHRIRLVGEPFLAPSPPKQPKERAEMSSSVAAPLPSKIETEAIANLNKCTPDDRQVTRTSSRATISRVNSVISISSGGGNSGGEPRSGTRHASFRQRQAATYLTDVKKRASLSRTDHPISE